MNLLERAKGITFKPKNEWTIISEEKTDIKTILIKYFLPLVLIPTIASFIGYGLLRFGHYSSINYGIMKAIVSILLMVGGIFLSAFIIDALAPSFGGTKNFERAFALVVYTYTPQLLAGILYIFPPLAILVGLAGLYGLYILYLGIQPMMKCPEDKTVTYFIVSIAVIIVVYAVLSAVLGAVFVGSIVRATAGF
jgi:hypothetical protein